MVKVYVPLHGVQTDMLRATFTPNSMEMSTPAPATWHASRDAIIAPTAADPLLRVEVAMTPFSLCQPQAQGRSERNPAICASLDSYFTDAPAV